ncbi:6642_t:CDS:2, partial [Acaulospora colombiana]
TAQVANQQGKYLGKKLNKLALAGCTNIFPSSTDYSDSVDNENPDFDDRLEPFSYAHFGSLAYIGNSAVADFGTGYTWMGGLAAAYLWRSVYFSEQVSFRTRSLLAMDWTKTLQQCQMSYTLAKQVMITNSQMIQENKNYLPINLIVFKILAELVAYLNSKDPSNWSFFDFLSSNFEVIVNSPPDTNDIKGLAGTWSKRFKLEAEARGHQAYK